MKQSWVIWMLLWGILAVFHVRFGSVEGAWNAAWSGEARDAEMAWTILWELRALRLLMASGAGAGLALCGLLLQTWFHNPLAGPSVLGIASGATLGVAVAVLGTTALGVSGMLTGALCGSGAVLAVLWWVSRTYRNPVTLLVFGLMLGYVVGALVNVLQVEASKEALQAFVFWGMGSFSRAQLPWVSSVMGATVIGALWAWSRAKSLDAWTLGPLTASSMGVPERHIRTGTILVTGTITAVVTAACGPIAFVGVATPHLVRMLQSSRTHRSQIPNVLWAGASLALLADGLVRWSNGGWPLNAVLSILAGPLLVYVLLKKTWAP